jgi:hypothetical protein
MHIEIRNACRILVAISEENRHSENTGVTKRIILKGIWRQDMN